MNGNRRAGGLGGPGMAGAASPHPFKQIIEEIRGLSVRMSQFFPPAKQFGSAAAEKRRLSAVVESSFLK